MGYVFQVVKKRDEVYFENGISLDKLDALLGEWFDEEAGNEKEELHDKNDNFEGYRIHL